MTRILAGAASLALVLAAGTAFASPAQQIGAAPDEAVSHGPSQAAFLRQQDRIGKEMTKALNELGAAGYFQISDMHAQGGNIVVTATKDGKSQRLEVTPLGEVQPLA